MITKLMQKKEAVITQKDPDFVAITLIKTDDDDYIIEDTDIRIDTEEFEFLFNNANARFIKVKDYKLGIGYHNLHKHWYVSGFQVWGKSRMKIEKIVNRETLNIFFEVNEI